MRDVGVASRSSAAVRAFTLSGERPLSAPCPVCRSPGRAQNRRLHAWEASTACLPAGPAAVFREPRAPWHKKGC